MTTGLAALEPLVDLLTPSELIRVAASLESSGRARRAAREVSAAHEGGTLNLLGELLPEFGTPRALGMVLRVVVRTLDQRPEPPTVIWSGPNLSGDSVRTTSTIATHRRRRGISSGLNILRFGNGSVRPGTPTSR